MLHLASARHATRWRGVHVHPRTSILLASALPEARLAHAIADEFPLLEAEAARSLASFLFRRVLVRVLQFVASLAIAIIARLCKRRVLLRSVVATAQLPHVRHRAGAPHQSDAEEDEKQQLDMEHTASGTTNVLRETAIIMERRQCRPLAQQLHNNLLRLGHINHERTMGLHAMAYS